ncbi:MAG: M48 family metallopeptidase [Pseudomonadota bacterium]|nr:M48 family metallopeptidase [Pseudomonadota bacterium]
MNKWFYPLIIGLLLVACATSPTGRKQLMLIPPESAIVESKTAYLATMEQLEEENKLVRDPQTVERIRTITGRLVTEAVKMYPRTRDWEWSVAIIEAPDTLNAWCMAGGRMAIYTGIIQQLNLTDAEIAQIMGHEISHALANHTAEQMSRAMAINLGITAAGAASDNNAIALTGAALAAKLALQLPNSRTAESEADRIGIELATRAGYAPEAAVSLWQKMERAGGGGPPEFLSTHPSPGNRQQTLSQLVGKMKQLNPNASKSAVYPVDIVQ